VVAGKCSSGRRIAYWGSPRRYDRPIDHTWTGSTSEALNAHFIQPDGTSRPGTHWRVDLEHGEETFTTLVLTYLAEEVPSGDQPDAQTQAKTELRHVFDRLEQGWTPEQGELPPIALSSTA
jgi:hypothetical protein